MWSVVRTRTTTRTTAVSTRYWRAAAGAVLPSAATHEQQRVDDNRLAAMIGCRKMVLCAIL